MTPSEDSQLTEQTPVASDGAPEPAPPQPKTPWWRWAVGGVIVVALVYPIARRVMVSGVSAPVAAAPAGSADEQRLLSNSFQMYQAGRYSDAINFGKQVLKLDPNSADAYNNMAVSYLRLQMYDDAIQSVQQALRIRPDYQLAKNNLAWIISEKTKGGGGTPTSAATKQETPEYYLNRSLELYQARQWRESIDAAQVALKLRPNYAEAYNNIAAAYAGMGQWDDAIRNAQQALRISPDFQLAKNNLAWALSEKKKSGK